jgi:TetR/AcrR family transcriptional repressor of nem operon
MNTIQDKNTTNKKQKDAKQHILDVGYQLIASKGFTSVGLAEILKTAAVPKGSFYHYFKSKEQFGEALITDYFSHYFQQLDHLFIANGDNGYQRIMRYWHGWLSSQSDICNMQKCLVVKLSAEVADLSDPMRHALLSGAEKIITMLAQVIAVGIEDKSIAVQSANSTAQTLYYLWLGASLMAKLHQSDTPLQQALQTTEKKLTTDG